MTALTEPHTEPHCELCQSPGGEVVFQGMQLRVVLVDDANYPGFCRVIWRDHVAEVTDLPELDRMLLMDVLWQVETVVRAVMSGRWRSGRRRKTCSSSAVLCGLLCVMRWHCGWLRMCESLQRHWNPASFVQHQTDPT